MKKGYVVTGLFALLAGPALLAFAQEPANSNDAANSNSAAATHSPRASNHNPDQAADEAAARIEGEKRFRTNCGRCHMPPHKFPPRIMAAAIRHMRVRAMLTDEDMRLILKYMTQ